MLPVCAGLTNAELQSINPVGAASGVVHIYDDTLGCNEHLFFSAPGASLAGSVCLFDWMRVQLLVESHRGCLIEKTGHEAVTRLKV